MVECPLLVELAAFLDNGKTTTNEFVPPIKNSDFPASHVSELGRSDAGCLTKKSHSAQVRETHGPHKVDRLQSSKARRLKIPATKWLKQNNSSSWWLNQPL